MFDLEFNSYELVIGCDEVGRGPLAGPVVGAAVSIEGNKLSAEFIEKYRSLGIADSKKITAKKREKILTDLGIDLFNLLPNKLYQMPDFSFQLQENPPSVIDEINILNAALDCMSRSAKSLLDNSNMKIVNSICLVDGNRPLKWDSMCQQQTVIKGDSKSILIGLASVIAKQYRDHLMQQLDKEFPGYGLAKHAGYPTKEHKEAIRLKGPSIIHRRSFGGVKEFC